jgi:hypothetical protein
MKRCSGAQIWRAPSRNQRVEQISVQCNKIHVQQCIHAWQTCCLRVCTDLYTQYIHVLHTIYSSLTFTKDINQHAEIAVHNCHFSSQLEMMHNTLQTDGDVSTLPPTPNMKAYIHAIAFTFILCMHLAYCAHNIFVQIQHLPFHSPKW